MDAKVSGLASKYEMWRRKLQVQDSHRKTMYVLQECWQKGLSLNQEGGLWVWCPWAWETKLYPEASCHSNHQRTKARDMTIWHAYMSRISPEHGYASLHYTQWMLKHQSSTKDDSRMRLTDEMNRKNSFSQESSNVIHSCIYNGCYYQGKWENCGSWRAHEVEIQTLMPSLCTEMRM